MQPNHPRETYQRKNNNEESIEKENPQNNEEVRVYKPPLSFPRRLNQAKIDEKFSRFVNMFKKLEINILLLKLWLKCQIMQIS